MTLPPKTRLAKRKHEIKEVRKENQTSIVVEDLKKQIMAKEFAKVQENKELKTTGLKQMTLI